VLGGLQALPAQKMIRRGEVGDRAVEALQELSGRRHQPVAGAMGGIWRRNAGAAQARSAAASADRRAAPARRAPPGRPDSPGHVCKARIGCSRSTAVGRNADTPTASCLDFSGGLSQKALVIPSFATAPLSAALFAPPHSFFRTRVENLVSLSLHETLICRLTSIVNGSQRHVGQQNCHSQEPYTSKI
jgi:hypothetical protein